MEDWIFSDGGKSRTHSRVLWGPWHRALLGEAQWFLSP